MQNTETGDGGVYRFAVRQAVFDSDRRPSLLHSCRSMPRQSQLCEEAQGKIGAVLGLALCWFSYLEHFRMRLQGVTPGVETLWSTYLHLWSALSSSGVSLSKYWNAIFTSSMKSWKIQYLRLKEIEWRSITLYFKHFFKYHVYLTIAYAHNSITVLILCHFTCPLSPWGYFFSRSRTCGIWHEQQKEILLVLLNSMCAWILQHAYVMFSVIPLAARICK